MPRKIILPPADPLDPEIAREMLTWEIRVPTDSELQGALTAEEIGEMQSRDQKTLIAMSGLGKWVDWNTDTILQVYAMVRKLDAEQAREKIGRQKKEEQDVEQRILWQMLKWFGVTIGAGALSALAQKLF